MIMHLWRVFNVGTLEIPNESAVTIKISESRAMGYESDQCKSAQGLDADRRDKPFIKLAIVGFPEGADSQSSSVR